MKYLKFAIFIALFTNSVTYATSEKLPDNSQELVCHQMSFVEKNPEMYAPYLWKVFRNKDYIVRYEYKIIDVYKSKTTASYEIIENNISLKKLIVKNLASFNFTNINLCNDSQENQYFVLEQDDFESEDDDGRYLSGKEIFIIDASNKNNIKNLFLGTFYDQYFKVSKKQTSQFHIFSGYSPEKLLSENKPLPITYTMYEKDGGLYMKVGSTYKSDIITLKKPNSVK